MCPSTHAPKTSHDVLLTSWRRWLMSSSLDSELKLKVHIERSSPSSDSGLLYDTISLSSSAALEWGWGLWLNRLTFHSCMTVSTITRWPSWQWFVLPSSTTAEQCLEVSRMDPASVARTRCQGRTLWETLFRFPKRSRTLHFCSKPNKHRGITRCQGRTFCETLFRFSKKISYATFL